MGIHFTRLEEKWYISIYLFRKFIWVDTTFPFIHRARLIRPPLHHRIIKTVMLKLIDSDPQVRHILARLALDYSHITIKENGNVLVHWKK